MDGMVFDILERLGIGGIPSIILYFILRNSTEKRKEDRDFQYDALKQTLEKHLNEHNDKDREFLSEIKRLHDRLNPIADSISRVQGYFDAMESTGKRRPHAKPN